MRSQRGFLLNPFRFGAAANTVSLLLHGEGSDGSTTFTDSSGNSLVPTVVGNAQIDTAQFKFGSASMLFDGSSDGLDYAANAAFGFGTSDTTWEMFARFDTLAANRHLIGFGPNNTVIGSYLRVNTSGVLALIVNNSQIIASASSTITTGTWYYIATKRSGTTWTLVYGTSGSTTSVGTASGGHDFGSSGACTVGCISGGGFGAMSGWLDEVRVSKGLARDISTVPTGAF